MGIFDHRRKLVGEHGLLQRGREGRGGRQTDIRIANSHKQNLIQ